MSADSWAICPRCKLDAEASQRMAFDLAAESYGQVPAEEYEKMRAAAQRPTDLGETLREDYEFCLSETGEFYASFSAECQLCAFSYDFEHKEQVGINDNR